MTCVPRYFFLLPCFVSCHKVYDNIFCIIYTLDKLKTAFMFDKTVLNVIVIVIIIVILRLIVHSGMHKP